ncbi:MAG TPA: ABC transporter ATP-binding protein, partial [Thermomicrobiaceae bacterium]|nr:ABC transporter ATP-binding protein [Thermomicrobiaceae bacterium]
TPITLLRELITLIGGIGLMVAMNWRLSLLILVVVPPIVVAGAFFGRRLQRLSIDVQDHLADSTVSLEEMLSGIRIVKSFTREPWERARFARAVDQSLVAALRRARLQAVFIPTVNLLGSGAVTLLIWYGGRLVIRGALTPGDLIAFLVLMVMVAQPLGDMAGQYGRLRQGLGSAHRVFRLLDVATEPLDVPGALLPGRLRGSVRFAGVSFAYDGLNPILHDVSLDVAPGEVVALVGPSGAGKSTLVNLIPRFHDATRGVVEIDGEDARRLDLRDLREQIGLVPQETFLFGGTVRENIAYGRPRASDEEIRAAARDANADAFVRDLPEGYDTVVGEKGVRLSAGQRQRIAIARVLLKDPRLLILDEATSSLDTVAERQVQEALERVMAGRTTFVIAHRLTTVLRADRILVLEGGRIVEEGTHAALLARGGLYRRLWSLQFREADDAAATEPVPGSPVERP